MGVRAIFRRFWPETRPFRGRLLVSLLLVMLDPAIDAASLWLFKILIDDVLAPKDFTLFPWVAAGYLAITVVGGFLSFADEYLSTWAGERFVLNLRSSVFAHLQTLSLDFFERHQLGDVLSRLTGDISAIEGLVLSGVTRTVSYVVKILVFAGVLFYLDWQLAAVSLIVAPGFMLASRYFSRRIKKASREKRRRSGAIAAAAEESLGNVALVQAYHRQRAEADRFHEENLGSFVAQMIATRLQALFGPLIDLLEVIGVLVVLGMGVWALAEDRISLGGLLVFVGFLSQLYSPIRGIGRLSNSIYAATAGAERIIELLDQHATVVDPAHPRVLERATGLLTVEGASFTYPGTSQEALTDVSFVVAAGQKVAVVGASGAGKSTLGKLLLRFYDPDAGSVAVDDIDLRNLRLEDLRRNVTAVLQETLVFDGTIRDNILWGKPDATEREVQHAAVVADAHDFITALPDGYDTRIGQRGRLLSGGQRQRLAIARAVIRDAPVLLLDEPTTGLDAASTERILTPLRRLMAGRTTIIISHNLLTVTDADRILFLDRGRITASGTHTELLAASPGYAELYRLHRHGDADGRATPPASSRRTAAPQPRPSPPPPSPPPPSPPPPSPTPARQPASVSELIARTSALLAAQPPMPRVPQHRADPVPRSSPFPPTGRPRPARTEPFVPGQRTGSVARPSPVPRNRPIPDGTTIPMTQIQPPASSGQHRRPT